MDVEHQVVTDDYALYLGDCIDVLDGLPDNGVHLSVYSPPFGGLYNYSSSERDLSNCKDYVEFFEHYDYVVQGVGRTTIPGRVSAVHCMDVPSGNSGKDHMWDFPGDIIEAHCKCRKPSCTAHPMMRRKGLCGHGWFDNIGRYHVWKEPLGVRNRLMLKNLAHKTIVDDSSRCSLAAADYVLAFRKKGDNPIPIAHPTGFEWYSGEKQIPQELHRYKNMVGDQKKNKYSHWIWRRYADAFWDDIRIDRVLPFLPAKDDKDEKHVHPLQLDVIERIIHLWSNPKEIVFTPFMGVGSEVFAAVSLERKGVGAELKASYFRQAVKNCANALEGRPKQKSILDFCEMDEVKFA